MVILLVIGVVIFLSDDGMVYAQQVPNGSLDYSTFLGTTGGNYAHLWEVTFDSVGNIVVVGFGDYSPDGYPGLSVTKHGPTEGRNVLVAKLSPDGSDVLWVTLVGGSDIDFADGGVVVDGSDDIYVSGKTFSDDFPTTPGAWDTSFNSVGSRDTDAFVFKLSSDGQTLIYSTYLGGSNGDSSRGGLAVDNQGFAYVVGGTSSTDYLDEGGVRNPAKKNDYIGGTGDGFVTKVSQDGSSIVYSRFIGGPNETQHGDVVVGIQVDSQGYAFIHGIVRGTEVIPPDILFNPFDNSFNGGEADSYFGVISPDGTQIEYASYFGGTGAEFAEHRIALDSHGNVYMTGYTGSSDFPNIPNINGSQCSSADDGYLIKFEPFSQSHDDYQPTYSTCIGASAQGPAIDSNGNIYVAGRTGSLVFPVTANAYDKTLGGNQDATLQIFSPTGQLSYSTYLGGNNVDGARYVAIDMSGDAVVVGQTTSADFPITPQAYDATHGGNIDVFVSKFKISSNWKQMLANWLTSIGDQNGDGKVNSLDWATIIFN
jgi:hypothetical protein